MPPVTKRAVEKRRANTLKTRPQVRKTFPPEAELRALARSVMKQQIHPLIVLHPDILLDGECRWRGVMLENPEFELDCIVVEKEPTPAEITEMQLVSGLHSNALTPHDQAVACRDWLNLTPGATTGDLAAKIDRDPSMVVKLVSLFKTIPAVQKAAAEGKVGPKAWYQISLLPEADQQGLLEMYLSGMPASQVEQISRDKRRARPAPATDAARVQRVKCDLPGGMSVVVSGQAVSLEESIEALGNAIKEMKRARELGYTAKTFAAAMRDKAKVG